MENARPGVISLKDSGTWALKKIAAAVAAGDTQAAALPVTKRDPSAGPFQPRVCWSAQIPGSERYTIKYPANFDPSTKTFIEPPRVAKGKAGAKPLGPRAKAAAKLAAQTSAEPAGPRRFGAVAAARWRQAAAAAESSGGNPIAIAAAAKAAEAAAATAAAAEPISPAPAADSAKLASRLARFGGAPLADGNGGNGVKRAAAVAAPAELKKAKPTVAAPESKVPESKLPAEKKISWP